MSEPVVFYERLHSPERVLRIEAWCDNCKLIPPSHGFYCPLCKHTRREARRRLLGRRAMPRRVNGRLRPLKRG